MRGVLLDPFFYFLKTFPFQGHRPTHSAPHHKPLDPRYGNAAADQNYDFNFGSGEDSACPPNYRPNPAKPPNLPTEKNYYSSPKKVKTRGQNIRSRPDWVSDLDTGPGDPEPRKRESISSGISTVDLQHQHQQQPFKTINPARNMREPSKPAKNNRSSSLPSLAVKSPSNKKNVPEDYSYLDKYKPPPQYMTNRERQELLRIKQEKEKNNNYEKYGPESQSRYPYQSENKPSNVTNSKQTFSKTAQPEQNSRQTEPISQSSKRGSQKSPKKTSLIAQTERIVNRPGPDPSKVYAVPNKKARSNNLDAPKSKSEPSSKSTSRTSSTSNSNFSDVHAVKSASLSVASTASNFNVRTKVITFNDRKQSLGSLGAATITKLENNFKVRQFPDGGKQGLSNAVRLIENEDWEKNVEGLEMLASLASQHSEVPPAKVFNYLKCYKNIIEFCTNNMQMAIGYN